MNELDSVCPSSWRLPTASDWLAYFDFLAGVYNANPKIKPQKENISITGFSKDLNLFDSKSPLNIIPIGIYQGENFIYAPEMADYWIRDIPVKGKNGKEDYTVKVSYPGTAHIHLFNDFTNIHSHEHHLNPDEPESLRRFLVRCIKDVP